MAAAAPFMPLLSLAGGIFSAVGQMRSARGEERAADTQEEAARESARLRERNAALVEAEGREQARREREEGERKTSLTRARAAASGTTLAGTPIAYIGKQKEVTESQLDWLDYSTQERVRQERAGASYDYKVGKAQADVTRAGARQTRAGGWTTLIGAGKNFGESYNWWQKP